MYKFVYKFATLGGVKENSLTPYRRHLKSCKHKDKGQAFQACSCPIWAYGTLNGKPCRKSLDLRDWSRAERKIDSWIEEPQKPQEDENDKRTLKSAIEACIADFTRLNYAPGTITQYEVVLSDHLLIFATAAGVTKLRALTHAVIEDYIKSRAVKPSTLAKEKKIIKAFLFWCARRPRQWVTSNEAREVAVPKADGEPTMPFTRDEVARLIRAADGYGASWRGGSPEERRRSELRARALILFFLYTGMRLGDVAQFRRDRLDPRTGKIFLHVSEKTKVPVYLTLHPDALAALMAMPAESEYFFWDGRSTRAALVCNIRRIFDRLARRAGVLGAHPHRCRDTFAVELLLAGVPMHTVQRLLGHKSIRTTERSYAPYVAAFQASLDAATARLSFSSGTLAAEAGEHALGDSERNVLPFVPARDRTA